GFRKYARHSWVIADAEVDGGIRVAESPFRPPLGELDEGRLDAAADRPADGAPMARATRWNGPGRRPAYATTPTITTAAAVVATASASLLPADGWLRPLCAPPRVAGLVSAARRARCLARPRPRPTAWPGGTSSSRVCVTRSGPFGRAGPERAPAEGAPSA